MTPRMVVLIAPWLALAACSSKDGGTEAEAPEMICAAEPDTATDVAHEPPWRPSGTHERWTDSSGCAVRVDAIRDRRGPEHCGWQDTRVLSVGTPLGALSSDADDLREYVRDPAGSYGNPEFVEGFDADAILPADAQDSGFRRGEWELWFVPDDDSAIYLKGPMGIERWPRGSVPGCS